MAIVHKAVSLNTQYLLKPTFPTLSIVM